MNPKTNFSWRKSPAACRFINTKEFCFLCLATTQIKIEERNGNSSDFTFGQSFIKRPVSFLCLRRHLKINGISFRDTASLPKPKHEDEEVEANLCLDCEKIINKFSTLFKQLEKVQMEMDYQLNQLHLRILDGANNAKLVQQYSKEMTSDRETLSQLAWIDKLRKEISQKCIKSKRSATSIINLQRIETDTVPEALVVKTEEKEDSKPEVPSELIHPVSPCPSESSLSLRLPKKLNPNRALKHSKSKRKRFGYNMKSFVRNSDSGFHLESVHLGKRWKCDICNIASFNHSFGLARHKKSCLKAAEIRSDEEKARAGFKFPCPTCGKKFPARLNLQQHQNVVHSNSEFKCDRCSKPFKSLVSLNDHQKSVHLGEIFHCKYCKKEFRYRQSCNSHKKICKHKPLVKVSQSSATEPSFLRDLTGLVPCPSCSKTFPFPVEARRHYFSVHLKTKFKCDICKIAEFSYSYKLTEHQKTCRDTLKLRLAAQDRRNSYKFKCSTCEKRFRTRDYLNTHTKGVHSTIRNFQCDLCEKSFKSRSVLKDHRKCVHFKTTQPCKFCKKILNSSCLQKHEKNCGINKTSKKLEVKQELKAEAPV